MVLLIENGVSLKLIEQNFKQNNIKIIKIDLNSIEKSKKTGNFTKKSIENYLKSLNLLENEKIIFIFKQNLGKNFKIFNNFGQVFVQKVFQVEKEEKTKYGNVVKKRENKVGLILIK